MHSESAVGDLTAAFHDDSSHAVAECVTRDNRARGAERGVRTPRNRMDAFLEIMPRLDGTRGDSRNRRVLQSECANEGILRIRRRESPLVTVGGTSRPARAKGRCGVASIATVSLSSTIACVPSSEQDRYTGDRSHTNKVSISSCKIMSKLRRA